MGCFCLDCPHRGCNLPFYPAAAKQGIRREKPLNDFLIKPQIRAEQPYYLPPAVIYSPDCCSGSQGGSASAREDAGAGRGPSRQRDAARGCGCRDHPPSRQTPPLPQFCWQGKVLMPSTLKTGEEKKTPNKKQTSTKKVLNGITKKSEAQKQKSPPAPFLGTENGFPEQYHSFDTPVLVSQLPEEENRLKKNKPQTIQEALLAAMPPEMPLGGPCPPEQTPGAPHARALVVQQTVPPTGSRRA